MVKLYKCACVCVQIKEALQVKNSELQLIHMCIYVCVQIKTLLHNSTQ